MSKAAFVRLSVRVEGARTPLCFEGLSTVEVTTEKLFPLQLLACVAVMTPKDLKKMAKKAKGKSRIVAPGSTSGAGPEGPGPACVSSQPEYISDSGENIEETKEEADFLLAGQSCKQNLKSLQPGEYEIVHQGIVDLSELFGDRSTVRKILVHWCPCSTSTAGR